MMNPSVASLFLAVAPLVGAWIEIDWRVLYEQLDQVAPLVGAWIEINRIQIIRKPCIVAPLVGAWIEISILANALDINLSLLL